jgi:hypothetical protein
MADLRVDPVGLSAFAASCTKQAAMLRTSVAAGSSGPAFQASAAAVASSDSMMSAASRSLAERIDDLSAKLSMAASRYQGRDEQSGDALNQTVVGG